LRRAERLIREREMRRSTSVLSFDGPGSDGPAGGSGSGSGGERSPSGGGAPAPHVGSPRQRRASDNPAGLRARFLGVDSDTAVARSTPAVRLPASLDAWTMAMKHRMHEA